MSLLILSKALLASMAHPNTFLFLLLADLAFGGRPHREIIDNNLGFFNKEKQCKFDEKWKQLRVRTKCITLHGGRFGGLSDFVDAKITLHIFLH
ncbi:hypothetical protein BpHYR1_003932 [Brachionus plicatilis]|uniref:Uncharacterized protein n=1 Tax=Brachionus plicatilis TaxID=10195 RepID=A0A3M7QAH1_BRAPC|nr:hypothetical protein BpHYR1_003932 [Brachionus plicatilis]